MLVVFKLPTLFLFFALAFTFYRVKLFCQTFRTIRFAAKLNGICMYLVWVAYIAAFTALLVISYLSQGRIMNKMELDISLKCGLVTIFCLLFGGLVEIISSIIVMLRGIFIGVRTIFRYLRRRNNIQQ